MDNATRYTRGIFRLAERAGLRPEWRPPYRGAAVLVLNSEDEHGYFGNVHVGARSGRVLRGQLINGAQGSKRTYDNAPAVRRALAALAERNAPTKAAKRT